MSDDKFLDVVRKYHEPLDPAEDRAFIEKSFHILGDTPHPVLHKPIRWLAETAFWTLATMILAWMGFMAVDRDQPVRVEARHVASYEVISGGKIGLVATRTRLRSCYLKRDITIRDSKGVVHSITDDWESFGKADGLPHTETLEIRLPSDLPDGPATMDVSLFYSCNPLQRALHWPIELSNPTISFMVVPGISR